MNVVILRGKWAGHEAEVLKVEDGFAYVRLKDGKQKRINVRHISPL